jgi:hypothetical protein
MSRYWLIVACVLVIVGIAVVYAETKEPTNGEELVKVLHDKYGVECGLDRERKAVVANVPRGVEVRRAVLRVAQIETLNRLRIAGANLNKDLLHELSRLPELATLELLGCRFDEGDLVELKNFPALKDLNLSYSSITDAGLEKLKPLNKLEKLSLSQTKINGSGFSNLELLPLRKLDLSLSPITDNSLEAIGRIKTLDGLDLHNTSVSDRGIQHLTGLYRLVNLALNEHITIEGEEEFRKAYTVSRANAEKKGLIPKKYPQVQINGPSLDKHGSISVPNDDSNRGCGGIDYVAAAKLDQQQNHSEN